MKIQLISHASVLIETHDCGIWTDPWLAGKVFNDSWSLLPPAQWDERLLDRIDYIWISHEHPDHFHLPTLRGLPERFKQKVTLLFQELNSSRLLDAFRMLGFPKVRLLPHRKLVRLAPLTEVYCYYVGLMDSCLAVRDSNHAVLDANDAQLTASDCTRIRADLGAVDTLLQQFSIAFYSGLADHELPLRRMARGILERLYQTHTMLDAETTIPFASLMYFSSAENRYLNRFHNTPRMVSERFERAGARAAVLYPGDSYETGRPHDSTAALRRYDEIIARRSELPYDPPGGVALAEIQSAFQRLATHLHAHYPSILLRALRPLTVRIPDLGCTVAVSIARRSCRQVGEVARPDLIVSSQPLHFAFTTPYGFQTLGISGRLTIPSDSASLRLHRLLFALNNAELYLRPKLLFRGPMLEFLRRRSSGGLNLMAYAWRRMRRLSPLEDYGSDEDQFGGNGTELSPPAAPPLVNPHQKAAN